MRKIKAVMHTGKCLDSSFKNKAFAHNTNFSPVRKIKAVMHIGKCLDSSFKKKAFAQCLSLKSCLSLHLYALFCHHEIIFPQWGNLKHFLLDFKQQTWLQTTNFSNCLPYGDIIHWLKPIVAERVSYHLTKRIISPALQAVIRVSAVNTNFDREI